METMKMIWEWMQNQILGMQWLRGDDWKRTFALGLDLTSRVGGSVWFFLYDIVKITILLCLLIFIISYIQSYFPPEK